MAVNISRRSQTQYAGDGAAPAARRVVRVRHYGRGVFAVVVVVVAALIVYSLATNTNIDWPVVGQYLVNHDVLDGLLKTLEMTALGMIFSLIGAIVLAFMRMSESVAIRASATVYIFIFRGLPIILLLVLVGNLGLFIKHITIGIPFTGLDIVHTQTASVDTPFIASIVGLVLAGSAYMSEIVRGGLLAVGRGQHDAAKALGLNHMQTSRYIISPQAMRVIIPPMGNEVISMLKATAIVTIIGGGELMTVVQEIAGVNYETIAMLSVAAFWYLLVIALLTVGQHFIELRFGER